MFVSWVLQMLTDDDATALAMLLGTVSLQHDNSLPWWRAGSAANDDAIDDVIDNDSDISLDYYKQGRHYHGPDVADFDPAIIAIIARGELMLTWLQIQDGLCIWTCAIKVVVTPEHFQEAGHIARGKGVSSLLQLSVMSIIQYLHSL